MASIYVLGRKLAKGHVPKGPLHLRTRPRLREETMERKGKDRGVDSVESQRSTGHRCDLFFCCS